MAGEYTCTLSEASLKKAKEELGEDPKERLGAVDTFRKWIKEQKHLKFDSDDTKRLLTYLRTGKFSQLRAREVLENYLTNKTENPDWFTDVDTQNPRIQAFMRSGYLVPLPGYDPSGRKILLMRIGAFDPSGKNYSKSDMFKGFMAMFNQLMEDEEFQVNGVVYICDFTGFSMKHYTFWGVDDMKKSTKMWQNGFPCRFKGFHYYNTGTLFESIMAVIKPLMKQKFRDRIHVHGDNMEKIYTKVVPMEMLPVEYLPDDYKGKNAGKLDDILNDTIAKLAEPEVRNRILHMTRSEIGIDKSLKDKTVPQASFRKLNVD